MKPQRTRTPLSLARARLLPVACALLASACAEADTFDLESEALELESDGPVLVPDDIDIDTDSRDGEPIGSGANQFESSQSPQPRSLDFPPPVDGFVNPISPTGFATELNDGDLYYNANDWTSSGHCGEDWNYSTGGNSDYGEDVYATANGIVRNAQHYGPGWGNIVMIEHYIPGAGDPGYRFITSTYAHLSTYNVSPGDVVIRGQKIGEIGDADGAYYAHLHFEMRWDEDLSPTANAGYGCPNASTGTFDPSDFVNGHRTWEPNFDPNTDWGFCTLNNPCGPMEGDADSSNHCLAGTTYTSNTGARYGWDSTVDTCESQCHVGSIGGYSYCSPGCPCSIGEGDCDRNADCVGDLICRHDVGANYGWASDLDVCEACHVGELGGASYCSASCPCDEGEGDCDSDAQCAGSLSCIHDVGASYGFPASYDVCG